MAGAPVGNQNAVKAKRWSQAIDRALEKRSKAAGIEALDELAEKLLQRAEEGDLTALKELGDRMEGKPAQIIAGDPENPLHTVSEVRRTVVDPNPRPPDA
jgi:hypothetical protein